MQKVSERSVHLHNDITKQNTDLGASTAVHVFLIFFMSWTMQRWCIKPLLYDKTKTMPFVILLIQL